MERPLGASWLCLSLICACGGCGTVMPVGSDAAHDGDSDPDRDAANALDAGEDTIDASVSSDAGEMDGGVVFDDGGALDDAGTPPIPPSCTTLGGYDDLASYACAYERTHAPGETMPLDLFAPRDAVGAPVVLYVHGGGFIEGTRHAARPILARWAREAGVVGMTIEYELRPSEGPEGLRIPNDRIDSRDEMEFMRDAASALLWARDHVAAFGGDPNHIVVMGHSAGGIIVSLLSTDPQWIRDALVMSGRATEDAATRVEPTDLIAGMANLSGPPLIDLGQVFFGGRIQDLLQYGFSPAMQLEASALEQLRRGGGSPPILMTSGGGANTLIGDPAAIAQRMRQHVVLARSLGVSAHFIQPVFHTVRTYTDPLRMMYSGQPCWAHFTHIDTERMLAQTPVGLIVDQAYFEWSPGVCNVHVLEGVTATHEPYREAVLGFVLDPGVDLAWTTPGYTHSSVPDADPSPLRFSLGGGPLPGPDGEAWRDGSTDIAIATAVRFVTDFAYDRSLVRDADGAEVPAGLFHFQLATSGTSIELTVHVPVAAGRYVPRIYFGEAGADRRVDVWIEGALRASDVSSLGAVAGAARVVELSAVDSDATFDLTLRRHGASGRTPRIAALELVPVPP